MVVLDYIPSVVGDEDYPMAEVIARLHETNKLVIAYIDIGEAEDYRAYWQDPAGASATRPGSRRSTRTAGREIIPLHIGGRVAGALAG